MSNHNPHQEDSTWREYNVHGNADDEDQPVDIFAISSDDAYELLQYEICDNITVKIRSEKEYDKSTGLSVWTGSEVMCTYLKKHSSAIHKKKVVEVGAGCGLCGLVCRMALGADSVLITDGDSHVMKNIRYNVELNGLQLADYATVTKSNESTISCPQLIWGKDHAVKFVELFGKQNVIISTDCLYIAQSVNPLFETANELLSKSGIFLFINSYQWACPSEKVYEVAEEFGFVTSKEELWYHEDDKEQNNPVHVFRRRNEVC